MLPPPVARRRLRLALQPPTHANQHAERGRRRRSSVPATRCGQPVLAALARLPCQLHHHSALDMQHRHAQQPARPRQRDCIQPPARVLGGGGVGGGDRQLEGGRVRRAVDRERDPVLGRPARLSESRAQPRERRRGHGRDGRGQPDALRHERAAFLRGIDGAATADAVAAASAATTAASAASAVAPADTSAAPSSAATSSAATSAATPAATSAATTARAPFGGAESPPHLSSLLCDYALPLLPNRARLCLRGHSGGVKSVAWLQVGGGGGGGGGEMLVSGSNDATVRLWKAEPPAVGPLAVAAGGSDARESAGVSEAAAASAGECGWAGPVCVLQHPSRVWAVATRGGAGGGVPLLASACSDGRVRLWDARDAVASYAAGGVAGSAGVGAGLRLGSHEGDAYTVGLHPSEAIGMSGGYDAAVRLYDLTTGALLRSLVGHECSVSSAVFNSAGNLIVSGGKDATVRFWDARSGLCLKCFESPLGEVA